MKKICSILFIVTWMLLNMSLSASPLDSLKISTIKGKRYIIHKTDKGEGLISIAKRYNVSVNDIKSHNEDADRLKIGQKLKIPFPGNSEVIKSVPADTGKIKVEESHANADSKESGLQKTHIVQPGETLFKIAGKYKITVQQLINWNGIRNSKIDVGQELIIAGTQSTRSYEKWNTVNSLSAKTDNPQHILVPANNLIDESGFAVAAEANEHPGCKPGTLILVINPENNKQCFIIIDKTQQTPDPDHIIKLDADVFKKLDLKEHTARVVLKYNQ